MTESIGIEMIRVDGGTQSRAVISDATVAEYAQAMKDRIVLPPLDVFFDGSTYWLADGFHRFRAALLLGLRFVTIERHVGTHRDAMLFAVGANTTHGLRRTNADKRNAVSILLADSQWSQWSDSEVARRCGVHHSLVGDVRRGRRTRPSSLADSASQPARRFISKHGTEATMRVDKIGRKPKAAQPTAARKLQAVEGATQGVLHRLPRRSDARLLNNAVHTFEGILLGLTALDGVQLRDDPRAPQWRDTIERTIATLRTISRELDQHRRTA